MNQHVDAIQSAWEDIAARLESLQRRIYDEIKNYPPPITACDQQFNYLLEQRDKISHELALVRQARAESLTRSDAARAIDEFLQSSCSIDVEAARRIRDCLKE